MTKNDFFRGKIVLITGGSKGIGRETARLFGRCGAHIYICGRRREALDAVELRLTEEGSIVKSLQADVRDPEACHSLIETIEQTEGRLDILINNAGMSMRGSVKETDPSVFRNMVDINYLGAAYITHFAIPLLQASRGSIVFISSLSALHGLPMIGAYGSSKLALSGFSQSLRAELRTDGVHVGIVYVGFTENDSDKVVYAKDGSLVPLKRPRSSHSQVQVAEKVISCVLRRKKEMTLTRIGHLAAFAFRFFPGLSDVLVGKFAAKSDMFGDR